MDFLAALRTARAPGCCVYKCPTWLRTVWGWEGDCLPFAEMTSKQTLKEALQYAGTALSIMERP